MIKNGGSVIDDTSNMVRSLLSTIERKVEEEVNNRQRDLGETKDSIEQKLINMLDKIGRAHV